MIDVSPATILADDLAALLLDGDHPAALTGWARAHGVDPAIALLASELARLSEDGQAAFVAAFIAGVAVRQGDALRWLIWLWSDAAAPMRARFADPDELAAAEAIMEMHRRVLGGESIDAADWRAERRRFAAATSARSSNPAIEAILSSMWEAGRTPGAVADAARSWVMQTAIVDALGPADWSAAEYARVTKIWDAYGIEHARHNRRRPDESDEAYSDRMQVYMRDHRLELTDDDWMHWNAWKAHHKRLIALRTAELRRGLLAVIRA